MFDLIIRNGHIVTASEILPIGLDIGIKNGKISYIGLPLKGVRATETVDAQGAYITPGGIDSHVHIDQGNHSQGDTWETGSRSAIAGGNTTVIAFASQEKEDSSLWPIIKEYYQRADGNSFCDYAFHLIITNPTNSILKDELPAMVKQEGITSVKLYMTYDNLKLSDHELLNIMMVTRSLGMTTMIHAENHDMVALVIKKLEEKNNTDPFFHAVARPQLAESEATYRAISLAELIDTPILIVHMSAGAAVEHVRIAQGRLLPVYAETCPHYLLLQSDALAKPDFEGSKYVCSPPLRHDPRDLEAMWQALGNGTFTVFSSDHCPDAFDHPCGKKKGLKHGRASFKDIPNGLPGIETRLPLLFHHSGDQAHHRISLPRFVELTATNPAKLYGLSHLKGSITPGLDADLVIWYPEGHSAANTTISQDMLHHGVDYTPFEGFQVRNWPRRVYLRGKLAWDKDNGGLVGGKRQGVYVKRERSTMKQRAVNALGMQPGERDFWLK